MQDFVLVEVYVKLILLFIGVLDPTAPSEMQDPGHRDAFAELGRRSRPQRSTPQSSQLDARTTEAQRILRDGICKRYYNRYSLFAALKDPTKFYGARSRHGPVGVSSGDHNFSYAFDIACALFHGFSDGSAINKTINKSSLSSSLLPKYPNTSAGWTEESILENHFKLVHTYIGKWICSIAIRVAVSRHEVQGTQPRVPSTSRTVLKWRRTSNHDVDEFLVMEQALDLRGDDGSDCFRSSGDGKTPMDIHLLEEKEVDAETELFNALPKNVCSSLKYLSWWATLSATRDLSYMRVVASAMRGLKFGSGGLENDIGSMVDLFTPKRACAGLSYVETLSFLRINKDRMQYDARVFRDLPNGTWKEYIPGRHSKLPQLLPRDFAAEEDSFNNPVDLNVVERDGDSSESDGDDI